MIYRNKWEIQISEHAYRRADQRNVTGDMISATIRVGRIKWLGKDTIKFINRYKGGTLICVGKRKGGNRIKIITVEWRFK